MVRSIPVPIRQPVEQAAARTKASVRWLTRSPMILFIGMGLVGPLTADTEPALVDIKVHDKQGIEFRCGKAVVGTYQISPEAAKPYLWPLNAPGGGTVTRAWPM